MTGFKALLTSTRHNKTMSDPTVQVALGGTILFLKIDTRDRIVSAAYSGASDIWMSSLCELLQDMPLSQARLVDFSHWEIFWKDDQFFWDMKVEGEDKVFCAPLELLHAAIDIYRGRDDLYREESALICRCFGVREKDVLQFLRQTQDPSLEELSKVTKAGMSCRSCVPQLRQWLMIPREDRSRYFKTKPVADWIEMIDSALSRFPEAATWKMNVESMKGDVVIISYLREASQKEEEDMSKQVQGFFSSAVDPDLAFFLRRSRQR